MTQKWKVRLWRIATVASGAWFLWEWLARSHYGHAGVAFFLAAFCGYWSLVASVEKTIINRPTGTTIWRDRHAKDRSPIRK